MTIFDHINSLLFSKKKTEINCEDESQFSMFMVNRWASFYSPELANYINFTSNRQSSVFTSKQDQYNYLYNVLPKCKFKRISYIKKAKKNVTEKEEAKPVPEFYSAREYKNYVDLLETFSK